MTKVSFDIDDEMLEKLKKKADSDYRTVASQIRLLIEEYVDQ